MCAHGFLKKRRFRDKCAGLFQALARRFHPTTRHQRKHILGRPNPSKSCGGASVAKNTTPRWRPCRSAPKRSVISRWAISSSPGGDESVELHGLFVEVV